MPTTDELGAGGVVGTGALEVAGCDAGVAGAGRVVDVACVVGVVVVDGVIAFGGGV